MDTIKGVIEKKEVSSGEKDGREWTRTSFTISGKKYSTFKDLDFEEGDLVLLGFETNGGYNNVKTGVLVAQANPEIQHEKVADSEQVTGAQAFRNEGAEFGLSCNLALRKTLAHWDAESKQIFEDAYKNNVKLFFRWNKELRAEVMR